MNFTRTQLLVAAATLLSGVLAGGVIDRVMVGGPAWHALGAEAWAQFSRQADLGSGLVAYPVEGIGATLLILAAVLSNYFDRNIRRDVTLFLYFAAAFSIAGLILTAKAAPIMLSLASQKSSAEIERAFNEFFVWGLYLRGFVDTLAFIALVWALSNLQRRAG
jgi:F0F1-type ATP synthase membrane subunit c/vacuolar-type H+-ATPase subunit K